MLSQLLNIHNTFTNSKNKPIDKQKEVSDETISNLPTFIKSPSSSKHSYMQSKGSFINTRPNDDDDDGAEASCHSRSTSDLTYDDSSVSDHEYDDQEEEEDDDDSDNAHSPASSAPQSPQSNALSSPPSPNSNSPSPSTSNKSSPQLSPILPPALSELDIREDELQEKHIIHRPRDSYMKVLKTNMDTQPPISIGCGNYIEADSSMYVIRGATYLSNNVKVSASIPLYDVEHVEIFSHTSPMNNIANVKNSYTDLLYSKSHDVMSSTDRLHSMIIISFMFPVGPEFIHFNIYFRRRVPTASEYKETLEHDRQHNVSADYHDSLSLPSLTSFDTLLSRYINGDDTFRNNRLKLIPRVHDGNWLVKKVIGQNPALLCKSISCKHYNDPTRNISSIDIDVTSSTLASNILSVVKGYAKSLTIDLMFLLQGEMEDELQESLIGGVRMMNIDLNKVDSFTENILRNKSKIAQRNI